jgi:hypothetical protein
MSRQTARASGPDRQSLYDEITAQGGTVFGL